PEYMVPAAWVCLPAFPVTQNGKVDRKALPAPHLGAKAAQDFAAPRTEVERKLAEVWASVLKQPRIGVHDNFFELGGDSIISIHIVAQAHQVGLKVTSKQLFRHQTIAALAPVVVDASKEREQGRVQGPVPLTPIQKWLFEQDLPQPQHFNMALMLEVAPPVEARRVEESLQALVEHHDALRLSFRKEGSAWKQVNEGGDKKLQLERVNVSHAGAGESAAIAQIAKQMQEGLKLGEGPLLKAALFERGEGKKWKLLLVLHHLVVDVVSWRILLEDLNRAYAQRAKGEAVRLPAKTTSFKVWAERLEGYAQGQEVGSELEYWAAAERQEVRGLPVDRVTGANTVASERRLTVGLEAEETRVLLQEVPGAYRAQINDVLLTALAQSVGKWSGQPRVLVNLEGHGREELFEDVDVSRTVGWFTSIFPVMLDLQGARTPGEALRAIREELRRLPRRGIGYGVLRYLRQDGTGDRLKALPRAQVGFNYVGQFDAMAEEASRFRLTQEPSGETVSGHNLRADLLEVHGQVFGGRLELTWAYSENFHERATIEALAQDFMGALRQLIAQRSSADAARRVASDFPLARLDPAALERVLQQHPGAEDIYPLSPLQQGMLFHALLSVELGMYFEQAAWRFGGTLQVPAFRRAWQELVARNPILRTAFFWKGVPEPLQVVHPRVELPWQELDWREMPAAEQRTRLESFLLEDRHQGFELARPPMMRVAVIRMGESDYRIIWSFHHVLLDGWSSSLLLKDLFELYEAFVQGRQPQLPHRPAFREYIAWLQGQDSTEAQAYWTRELQGFTAPTPLPGARNVERRAGESSRHRECEVRFPETSSEAVQAFARKHKLTVNTVAQAAWALVLGRYSGEPEVVFGSTVAGRPPELAGVDAIAGMLINTLPIRVRLPSAESILSWIQGLQAQQLEQRQHQHCALVQIQKWSEVPRERALFDSLFVFDYPMDASVKEKLGILDAETFQAIERTNYPLTATLGFPRGTLELRLSYEPQAFDAALIEQALTHWKLVLERIVAFPEQRLSGLSLMTEDERLQVLETWNQTSAEYPREQCVHQLFEAQAERTPEAVAVRSGSEQVTYGELNRRANQLAHLLVKKGVGPETLVGLCTERTVDTVVGLLGILKAGGAYVPLDP
ncbi:non-ribosomal peptide synthase domain TIGR01720, partial [Stigmatella aurantiaca]